MQGHQHRQLIRGYGVVCLRTAPNVSRRANAVAVINFLAVEAPWQFVKSTFTPILFDSFIVLLQPPWLSFGFSNYHT